MNCFTARQESIVKIGERIGATSIPLNETFLSDMIDYCFGRPDKHSAHLLKRVYPSFSEPSHDWPQRLMLLTELCDIIAPANPEP